MTMRSITDAASLLELNAGTIAKGVKRGNRNR